MNKQSKTVQIVLVVAVALIWGLVAWRFKRLSSGAGQADDQLVDYLPPKPKKQRELDSLSLLLNYPNPFLATYNLSNSTPKHRGEGDRRSSQLSAPIAGNTAPGIQYTGFSKDQTSMHRARLQVDGFGVTMAVGQQYRGVQLLKIERDSVLVLWNTRKIVIKRQ